MIRKAVFVILITLFASGAQAQTTSSQSASPRLPAPATPADQATRYISLAYALGLTPLLDAPERSDDLPGGVLEVLDFAPLVREFYRKSAIDERLISYMRASQAEGDRLRQP